MELVPILSAMRRNRTGAILIAVQIAVTFAILCNALFVIEQRIALSKRPTGTDEANIFVITSQWAGRPDDLTARIQTDLSTLRGIPGVRNAFVSNGYPLGNLGWADGVNLDPDQKNSTASTSVYLADEHAVETLGVRLVGGRNFNPSEVTDFGKDFSPPSVVIVTRALARRLFPNGDALGKTVYLAAFKHATQIIGIVDELQGPWTASSADTSSTNSMLWPMRYIEPIVYYVVRTQAGKLSDALTQAQSQLTESDRSRVLKRAQSLTAVRADAYRDDRGIAAVLAGVCVVSLAVTAFGIVGLTSYWVTQRQCQIGIRRALGATRATVVRYFQLENLLIAMIGAVAGLMLSIGVNLWMVKHFAMPRLDPLYIAIGTVLVLVLGQGAVLWPALRAALLPPALVVRRG